jgi:phage-related protein
MKWQITFYNEKVEQETLNFPPGILANFLHIAEMIEELGPRLGKPYTASMGGGLFEIRAKGKEGIGRSLFCMLKGREVIIAIPGLMRYTIESKIYSLKGG